MANVMIEIRQALDSLHNHKGFPKNLSNGIRCDCTGGTTYGPNPLSIDASMATEDELKHALALACELAQGWAAIMVAVPGGIAVAANGRIIGVETDSLRFLIARQNGKLAAFDQNN